MGWATSDYRFLFYFFFLYFFLFSFYLVFSCGMAHLHRIGHGVLLADTIASFLFFFFFSLSRLSGSQTTSVTILFVTCNRQKILDLYISHHDSYYSVNNLHTQRVHVNLNCPETTPDTIKTSNGENTKNRTSSGTTTSIVCRCGTKQFCAEDR